MVYDAQYVVKDLFDEQDDLRARDAEVLHKRLESAVRKTVESVVGNDRSNLRVTELSSERGLEKLADYQKYSAASQARQAYLDGDDDEGGGFEFVFHWIIARNAGQRILCCHIFSTHTDM